MGYPPQGTISQSDLDLIKSSDLGLTYDRTTDSLEFLGETQTHETNLFPVSSVNYVTFTAGGTANTFGSWAEIADDGGNTLSDCLASVNGHVTGFLLEDISHKDKRYYFEIAYGDAYTVVSRHRFLEGDTKKLSAVIHVRIRGVVIPLGEKIYYRMMCEEASATCEVSFRYHEH